MGPVSEARALGICRTLVARHDAIHSAMVVSAAGVIGQVNSRSDEARLATSVAAAGAALATDPRRTCCSERLDDVLTCLVTRIDTTRVLAVVYFDHDVLAATLPRIVARAIGELRAADDPPPPTSGGGTPPEARVFVVGPGRDDEES